MTEQQLFGPYRLERVLGKGGSATVYLATHVEQGHQVALKVLPAEMIDEFKTRFRREIAALARLRHENIVRILAVGRHRRRPYYAMEHLAGESLQDYLDRHLDAGGTGLDLGFALSVAISVATALVHCHERGIWHRDVKPANIQVDDKGRVRLMDFGIAKFDKGGDITEVNKITGTPCYLSPEQLNGGTIDGRTDIYQLALVLYELVTGGPPFREGPAMYRAARRCREELPRPSKYRHSLSEEFDDVLLTALAPEQENRFETMAAFRTALCEVRKNIGESEGNAIADTSEAIAPEACRAKDEQDHDKLTAVLGPSAAGVPPEAEAAPTTTKKGFSTLRLFALPLIFLLGVLLGPSSDSIFHHLGGAEPQGVKVDVKAYYATIKWQSPQAAQSEVVIALPGDEGDLRAIYGESQRIFIMGLRPGQSLNADLRLWDPAGRLLACTNVPIKTSYDGAADMLKTIASGKSSLKGHELMRFLSHYEDKKVHKAILQAMKKLGWSRARNAINGSVKAKAPRLRWAAISLLGHYRRNVHVVLKALGDRDLEVRRQAFKALGFFKGHRGAFEAAKKYIFVENDPLLTNAIMACAQIDGRRSISVLKPLLGSVSRQIRIAAIRALGTVKDVRVYQILWDASLDEDDPQVIRELTKILRKLRMSQPNYRNW